MRIQPLAGLLSFETMLKQLLVTLLVATVFVLIARMKRGRDQANAAGTENGEDPEPGMSTISIAGYALAGVMIVTAGTLTWMGWKERNEIIEVVVVDSGTNDRTVYQVRRKALADREFETVDGRFISLGASDRMERVE